jgi:hypothetical protein
MADKSPAAHKNLVVHAEFHAHPLTFLNRLLTELTTPLCGSMFPGERSDVLGRQTGHLKMIPLQSTNHLI